MSRLVTTVVVLMAVATVHPSVHRSGPARPLRMIAFGAHPDDAELKAGGVAAMWSRPAHKVKFVAMTNGDVGHFEQAGGPLAKRRKRSPECARILGIDNEVLDIHDGELLPSLENRRTVARLIREWQADIVMGHRPYDYHPDHRYTGVLLDDAAVVVVAPFFVPDTPPTQRNPVFMYYSDDFQHPKPSRRHRRRRSTRRRRRSGSAFGDAVAVRRQGLVAGAHAARRAADRCRAAVVFCWIWSSSADRGRRLVSRLAGGSLRGRARQ